MIKLPFKVRKQKQKWSIVGPEVIRVFALLERCVIVNNSQEELKQDNRVLRSLVNNHNVTFGIWAKVEVGGKVIDGDKVYLE